MGKTLHELQSLPLRVGNRFGRQGTWRFMLDSPLILALYVGVSWRFMLE